MDKIINMAEDGLQEIVLKQYKQRYSASSYLLELSRVLDISPPLESEEQAKENIESPGWLIAIWKRKEIFANKIGMNRNVKNPDAKNGINFVGELLNARNRYSHRNQGNRFTNDDVCNLADTATRLLKAVKATEETAITEEIEQDFGRRLYNTEAEASKPEPASYAVATDEAEDPTEAKESTDAGAQADDELPERVDLSGLNLSDTDLRKRNLHLANLKGADLSNSNLDSVSLEDMDLSDVRLLKTDLSNGKLANSRINRGDLSDALLQNADLTGANLSYATLEKADLRGAIYDQTVFRFANLSGADLSNSKDRIDPRNSTFAMDSTEFHKLEEEWEREGVNFYRAILRETNMQRVWLYLVCFTGADMTDANLANARIVETMLNGAILHSADLTNCDFMECDFTGAKMRNIIMKGAIYIDGLYFKNADLSGANLEGIASFSNDPDSDEFHVYDKLCADNADMSMVNLCDAVISGSSLRNVKLTESNLSGANLKESDLTNADLTRAVFKDADLSSANLSNTDLNETDFTGADLTCADFTGARFYYLSTILPDGTYWDEDTDMTSFTGPLDDC
ncbi:MAG: pentapeptide repeat-containing protein [Chloroflexi bacterium]|nr:pentapeptide repeat-containing protein [Chloroflexota bacterium]